MFVLGSCESNTPETPDPTPVTGITLNESSVSMQVGDTRQLTAEIQPENADNRTVSWESSDNGTATVDESGLITAIAVGEAVITATVEDKSATCTVTVSEPAQNGNIDMTGMTLRRYVPLSMRLLRPVSPSLGSPETSRHSAYPPRHPPWTAHGLTIPL